jgi:hypothetical protein
MAATAVRSSIVVQGGFFHCPSQLPTGSCLSHMAPPELCLCQALASTTQKSKPNLESKWESVLIASLKRGVEVFRSYEDCSPVWVNKAVRPLISYGKRISKSYSSFSALWFASSHLTVLSMADLRAALSSSGILSLTSAELMEDFKL